MTDTTDRELLARAAKAAGLEIEWDARGPYLAIPGISGNDKCWNPLEDDGDALRLAVKLNLTICLNDCQCCVSIYDDKGSDALMERYETCDEPPTILQTKEQATRRAIVRAAASLAKEQS